MTQEEKQLLLKDLCARLPYFENWIQYEGRDYIVTGYGHGRVSLLPSPFSSGVGPCPLIEEVKPYLRPMSSMTEEEEDEYQECGNKDIAEAYIHLTPQNRIDYLNSHHFDYRGLIPIGLALKAPDDMYK